MISEDQVFNLSKPLADKEVVSLKGEWNYYWGQKVTMTSKDRLPSGSLYVPNFWTVKSDDFLAQHPYGLLTLHSIIHLPDTIDQYTLKFKSVVAAHEIWANGRLLSKVGEVGVTKEETTPNFQPLFVDLPKTNQIELFWVISNFHHRKGGGSWEDVVFGKRSTVLHLWKWSFGFQIFSATIILLIAIYHLAMFLFYPKEKSYLFFSLGVFAVALRTITTGEMIVEEFIPNFPYELNQKLRYLGYYLPLGLLPLFVHYFFHRKKEIFVRLCLLIPLSFSIITILASVHVATQIVPFFHVIAPLFVIYAIVMVLQSIQQYPVEAFLFLVTSVLMFAIVFHAILISLDIISGNYLYEAGFLILILAQVLIVAYRHRKIYGERTLLQANLKHKEGDLAMVISDNQLRHRFREDLLHDMISISKAENGSLRGKLNSYIHSLKLKLEVEDKLDYFQENIESINREFESRLKTKYPRLTETDIEICHLITLNLSNKQMAMFRNTTVGTIKVAKSRIKKKLGLTADSLDSLIKAV